MALGLAVVGGPWAFFHFVEGSPPARLSLPAAGASGPVTAGPLSGTWKVGAGSEAGYRVQEILFGQHSTAVGRTQKVTGGMTISGSTVTAADFTVDMAAVQTNQAGREVQWHDYIMLTGRYPYGRFRLTSPIRLGSVPPAGRAVTERATGLLTLRGVTRSVTFTLRAERLGSSIDVNAEIPITFSEWKIPNPSFVVAKVGSTGTVELLLHLDRVG